MFVMWWGVACGKEHAVSAAVLRVQHAPGTAVPRVSPTWCGAGVVLCAAYYFFQASMMPLKSAALSDAPPMSPPSMSGFENSSGALLALQLPP